MAINHLELVSALVDGQLTGSELDQALDLIASNDEARATFMRYQQTSDILHGYTRNIHQRPLELTTRISAELENEAVYDLQPESTGSAKILRFPKPFWKQATGLAMAASVGALAVVGVVQQQSVSNPVPMASVASNESSPSVLVQSNRWTVAEPEIEDRLNNYLVDHNEYVGTSGMFSYGRVVSYGTER